MELIFYLTMMGMVGCHTTSTGTRPLPVYARKQIKPQRIVIDGKLEVCLGTDLKQAKWKTLKCKQTPTNYQRFIKSIKAGKNDQPTFERGWQIQKILDACMVSDQQQKTIRV